MVVGKKTIRLPIGWEGNFSGAFVVKLREGKLAGAQLVDVLCGKRTYSFMLYLEPETSVYKWNCFNWMMNQIFI